VAVLKLQRMPRHLYYRKIANSIATGKGIYDVLSSLDRDGVEYWFDDFHGNTLDGQYTGKDSTGATTVAASTAILASTASDDKYAGFTGGSINWFGNRHCLFQARAKIASAAITETKFELGWHGAVAGSAGLLNNIITPTWVGVTQGVCFAYDADATTFPVWNACAYNAATTVRILHTTGTATATATKSLTQTAQTYVADVFKGQTITAGGAHATVQSNTTKVFTVDRWIPSCPPATSTFVVSNSYNTTAANSPTVPKINEYHTYTIKIEGVVALYYIDGVQVAEIPAAVNAVTTGLTPWLFAQARGDGSENAILSVDYLLCMQSRET